METSTVAAAVRHHRLASGLTLEKLAAASQVSRSTLEKIEAGDTLDPGFSVVCRLLNAAGATDADVVALAQSTLLAVSPRAFGVGYEGLDQAGLIKLLRRQHVSVVADVRLTPLSRKAGLSKRALHEVLGAEHMTYVHLPALGNPKENRAGYSDPENPQPRRRFAQQLESGPGHDQLGQLRELARSSVVAVLCFENDETRCHREQVLQALRDPATGRRDA